MAPRAQVPVPAKLGDCDREDLDRSETCCSRERGATWVAGGFSMAIRMQQPVAGILHIGIYISQ